VGRLGFAGPTLSLDCKPEGPLAEALLVEDRKCHRLDGWPASLHVQAGHMSKDAQ
jgi:hypothetical protein